MAFFCPMRIIPRRRRKRYRDEKDKNSTLNGNSKGQIMDSNSVDSLNEQGKGEEDIVIEFEPRKMVVLHDFIPCVEDEVAVKRGQPVKSLYQETDWIYIVTNDGREGFIPFTYCITEEEYEKKKEKQKGLQRHNTRNSSLLDSLPVQTDMTPAFNFKKNNYGDYIVRFDFIACDENDINAQKGDKVTVLNKDDKDWYWVSNTRGAEGFIPKDFLVPFDRLGNSDSSLSASKQSLVNGSRSSPIAPVSPLSTHFGSPYTETSPESSGSSSRSSVVEPLYLVTSLSHQNGSSPVTPNSQTEAFRKRRNTNELLLYGHELVCIDTYIASRLDELTVNKGDWIYADMKLKDSRGWIWAYSPANKSQGFVPRSCVRPPATTPL